MKLATIGALTAAAALVTATSVLAQQPKAKPINYEARAKACDAQLKGQYNFETKIVARGFCLSGVKQDTYQEAKR
jgi:hypothetical protein